jgi:hypothetical protein
MAFPEGVEKGRPDGPIDFGEQGMTRKQRLVDVPRRQCGYRAPPECHARRVRRQVSAPHTPLRRRTSGTAAGLDPVCRGPQSVYLPTGSRIIYAAAI